MTDDRDYEEERHNAMLLREGDDEYTKLLQWEQRAGLAYLSCTRCGSSVPATADECGDCGATL